MKKLLAILLAAALAVASPAQAMTTADRLLQINPVAGVQLVSIGANRVGASSTITVTAAGGVPASALIVLVVYETSGSLGSVTDGHNTYTAGVSSGGAMGVFYSQGVTALTAGSVITYHVGTGSASGAVSVFYVTGILTSGAYDATVAASNGNSSSTPSVTSGVPAVAKEVFIGAVGFNNNDNPSLTQPGGWATPPIKSDWTQAPAIGGGSIINTGTTALTYNPTLGASEGWTALVVGFKPR